MSEVEHSLTQPEASFNWGTNYDTADGKAKIAARQAVYWCLADNIKPPDYDLEVIQGFEHAGIEPNATLLDIGSSKPSFHKLCKMTGTGGKLISIDPYEKQFGGLTFYEPQGGREEFEALLKDGDATKIANFLKEIRGTEHGEYEGITLIKAGADFIPVEDGSVDGATTIFSGYHAFKNPGALYEIKRKLRVPSGVGRTAIRAGIHADTTSGNENKETSIEKEGEVAFYLSRLLGRKILPPPPLQAGFTAERTLEVFPTIYNKVYVKRIEQEIIFNGSKIIIMRAIMTYRDSFIPQSGTLPDKFRDLDFTDKPVIRKDIFNKAVEVVVGGQIEDAEEAGVLITDKVRRIITFSSDQEINLPTGKDGYEQIA